MVFSYFFNSNGFQLSKFSHNSLSLPISKTNLVSHRASSHVVKMSDDVSIPSAPELSVEKKEPSGLWKAYLKTTDTLTVLFPLWTVLFAGLALIRPESFSWFTTKYFTASLGALMLSMGITLTVDDFTRVSKQPVAVIWGFILCYIMCPLLGLGLGNLFKLPIDLVAGLVLVGSINGGQASNLCTYIAKGDVALSVLMTTVTTVAGIFTTPLLCKLLLGNIILMTMTLLIFYLILRCRGTSGCSWYSSIMFTSCISSYYPRNGIK